MRILIVNDDGYFSEGITKLAEALYSTHDIIVVAPSECYSGMSHAMTFRKPIDVVRKKDYPWTCFSVSGTPADCVLIGLHILGDNKPDLILSGINNDPNLGTEMTYSGTVNAAIEASLHEIPAIAISGKDEQAGDFDYIVDYFMKNFDLYLSLATPTVPISVNINNIRRGNKANKLAHMGERKYKDIFTIVATDEGHTYTLSGEPIFSPTAQDSDVVLFEDGYATITPLSYDRTNYKRLQELQKKHKELTISNTQSNVNGTDKVK